MGSKRERMKALVTIAPERLLHYIKAILNDPQPFRVPSEPSR